jgi:hypothetical protein
VRVGRVLQPGARYQLARSHEQKSRRAPPAPFCRATSTGW